MHLIGLETCSSFLDQSQNWFDTFDTQLKTAQIRMANQNIGKYYKDSMRTQGKIKQTALGREMAREQVVVDFSFNLIDQLGR